MLRRAGAKRWSDPPSLPAYAEAPAGKRFGGQGTERGVLRGTLSEDRSEVRRDRVFIQSHLSFCAPIAQWIGPSDEKDNCLSFDIARTGLPMRSVAGKPGSEATKVVEGISAPCLCARISMDRVLASEASYGCSNQPGRKGAVQISPELGMVVRIHLGAKKGLSPNIHFGYFFQNTAATRSTLLEIALLFLRMSNFVSLVF